MKLVLTNAIHQSHNNAFPISSIFKIDAATNFALMRENQLYSWVNCGHYKAVWGPKKARQKTVKHCRVWGELVVSHFNCVCFSVINWKNTIEVSMYVTTAFYWQYNAQHLKSHSICTICIKDNIARIEREFTLMKIKKFNSYFAHLFLHILENTFKKCLHNVVKIWKIGFIICFVRFCYSTRTTSS